MDWGSICSAVRFVIYSNIEFRVTYVRRDQKRSLVKIPIQSRVSDELKPEQSGI